MGEFSLTHLLLLAIVVLIFFGPSRLPALGQSLGKAIRGFKQGLNEIDAEAKPVQEAPPTQLKSGTHSTLTSGDQTTTAQGHLSGTQTEKETHKV